MKSRSLSRPIPRLALCFSAGLCVVFTASANAKKSPQQPKEAMTVAEAYNQTGLELYPRIAESGEDFVFSPYSIGVAMAMTRVGASGDTAEEMDEVLNFPGGVDPVNAGNQALASRVEALNGQEGVVLSVANALALNQHGDLIHETYRELLAGVYGAELFAAPTPGPINAWVADKTNNMIKKLVTKLPPNAVCTILNAVYFNGTWAKVFEEDRTQAKPFHLAEGKTVNVPTMRQTDTFQLAKLDAVDVLVLPYKGHDLRLMVVVPHDIEGLQAYEKTLDITEYKRIAKAAQTAPGKRLNLSLPTFKIEAKASLKKSFGALGMESAFSAENADFGAMLGKETAPGKIWISDILHKAVIDVTEKGTEAAAATAVMMATTAARIDKPIEFTVDRPFLYLLVDRRTDAILFMGRVCDPR